MVEYVLIYRDVAKYKPATEGMVVTIRRSYMNQIEQCQYDSQGIVRLRLRENREKVYNKNTYAAESCKPK